MRPDSLPIPPPQAAPTPLARPERLRYVVVEGVIGVGKTSLAGILAERFGGHLVREEFEENPFLSRFYGDRDRWAFQTQMAFLASRFEQQKTLRARDLFHPFVVADYAFDKDRIFARVNLSGDELRLYEALYALMEPATPPPDLVVYLRAPVERLMQNIRRRGRSYEASLDRGYMDALSAAYDAYFFRFRKHPLLIIDVGGLDFVRHAHEREVLLREIVEGEPVGVRYLQPVAERSLFDP